METTAPLEQTWNLNDIFADDARFAQARLELEQLLPGLGRWQGRLGESAATLADALESLTDSAQRLLALRCYASLKSDEDVRVDTYQAMRQSVELLATSLANRASYVRPEILELDPATVEEFVTREPRLAVHTHYLRDLVRRREHVLPPDQERILADAALLTQTPSSLFRILDAVELPRPEMRTSAGESVRLTPVAFHKLRISPEREDRRAAFPVYFGAYRGFRETLGQNLYATVKGHIFRSRVRGYGSCLEAALDSDNIPVAVYRNLVSEVRERLPLIHRYYRLRARALGLSRLEYPDLYCSVTAAPPVQYTPEQAESLLLDILAPLGPGYVAALNGAFGQRWIDWHPRTGKRNGAYASGWAYDAHPYVLMNFSGDFGSVATLAHEMGHAMHSHFSNRTQPFATADYSIFVAEVASTVNEALLHRGMFERADSEEQRLYLLGSYLDGIRGTLFRQTMFAEFELEIHERAERGEVLTGEKLSEIYLRLLREYQGHGSAMDIADDYAIEWAAIPHMHYNFYVYQYSTGILAATALAAGIRNDGEPARERYLGFLHAGGSDYPLDVLRRAGVDLEQKSCYAAAFRSIENDIDRLEALLEDRG